MLKFRAWIISPLLFLPLGAQEFSVLPDAGAVPPPPLIASPLSGGGMPMPENLNISNFGGGIIEWNNELGLLFYRGPGIKVTGDNGMEIFSDNAVIDRKAETATLVGNVSVYQGNLLQRGERVVYDYGRKLLDVRELRASIDQILLESGKFTSEDRGGKKVYVGEDAGITTHDVADPNYWLRARKTTIYPGDKIVFKNLWLYAGDTPVFWLPYLSQPLNAELGYHFVPGARSNWGPYLLNTYGIMLGGTLNEETGENEDAWLLSRWHLDLRALRGVGAGVDLVDTRLGGEDDFHGLSVYYADDLAPDTQVSGRPRSLVDADRYRVQLRYRRELDIPDVEGDWRIEANLALLSDQHYLEDFDPEAYRSDPSPDNTLGIYRRDDSSLLSLYTRFRLNDFYRADTRLPEVSFDQARAPLFGLPVLHEGGTSFGVIGEKAADPLRDSIIRPLLKLSATDPKAQRLLEQLRGYERQLAEKILALPVNDPRRGAIQAQLLDSSYTRLNTYQELSLPLKFGGFLNIIPQAGLGYAHYGSVEGPVDSSDRIHLHVGTEASVKLSKEFDGFRYPSLGLDGLKHILQPYSIWSVVSTNGFDSLGSSVDRLSPTTRPRPLDPSRFTAVDDLQGWNILRLGMRNRLLTRRDQQSYEWLLVDTYLDAFIEDPEDRREFSNLNNDIRWRPLPWMGIDLNTQFPVVQDGSGFREITSQLRFMPNDSFEIALGYGMLNGHPVFVNSNRIDLRTYTRLSENWGFGSLHVLELDDGTLEAIQYTIHRDLGNWVAGVGLTRRDNRLQQEYGIMFSLTLKDFPSVSLPFRLDAE